MKKKHDSYKDAYFKIAIIIIIYLGAAFLDIKLLGRGDGYFILNFHSLVAVASIFLLGYGILTAIGRNRSLELTLIEKKSEMAAILDNIPDITWLKDMNARYLFVNRQFSEYLGISTEEIIGKTDFDIWDIETAENFSQDDQDVFFSGEKYQKGEIHC